MWFPSSSEVLAAHLDRFRRPFPHPLLTLSPPPSSVPQMNKIFHHCNIEGEVDLPQSPTFRTLSLGETQEHQQQVGTSPNLEGVPATRGTKSTSPPLSRIRRPRIFFFPDESDSEEESVSTVALPSGLGNQIPASCSTAPLISPSRMIATASSTDVDNRRTILKVKKSLNLYRDFTKDATAFNLHVEIADWKEICTALLTRHRENSDHMKHPEERNIASVVPPGKTTKGEEQDTLSSTDLSLPAQSPSFLDPTFSHSVRSDALGNFRRPDPECFPMMQSDLARRRCSYRYNAPLDVMQHWLKGHLFELKEDGSVYVSGRQWEIVYHSLLRCQEEACPQRGGFFFSENFTQHYKDHKKGLAPGNVLDGIEEREANELCAMRSMDGL
ncbi:hypothetical protein BU17DRAFT_61797 [Hysterangium stoloniferum]|nr:hypothetical protein BU17DRAFT_61797 [Hysterangium stoloniferum]